ncbi:hypothetical protein PRECH8_23590 [Insulibacter thermoxylanivorax]|uniref:Nucleoside-diphosphate sugar epimerase n=2 Tax=Insulibacter thermoxylanivorax TaxID=2749268 RepID=A0A916QHH6_9BACL|nr:hypothetical protein PRECH8_23590 [Insulibacter thermoxylanivorax]
MIDKQAADFLSHMAKAHEELANILLAAKDIALHTAHELVSVVPVQGMTFRGKDAVLEQAMNLTSNVAAYLNSIGDLQEALADNLEPVLENLREQEEE